MKEDKSKMVKSPLPPPPLVCEVKEDEDNKEIIIQDEELPYERLVEMDSNASTLTLSTIDVNQMVLNEIKACGSMAQNDKTIEQENPILNRHNRVHTVHLNVHNETIRKTICMIL